MIGGGHLECMICHRIADLGDPAAYLRDGWPKCCGETMRWLTAGELERSGFTPGPESDESYEAAAAVFEMRAKNPADKGAL